MRDPKLDAPCGDADLCEIDGECEQCSIAQLALAESELATLRRLYVAEQERCEAEKANGIRLFREYRDLVSVTEKVEDDRDQLAAEVERLRASVPDLGPLREAVAQYNLTWIGRAERLAGDEVISQARALLAAHPHPQGEGRMLTTTLKLLRQHDACAPRYAVLVAALGPEWADDAVLPPEQVEHAICDAVRAECEAHKAGLLKEEENRCAT